MSWNKICFHLWVKSISLIIFIVFYLLSFILYLLFDHHWTINSFPYDMCKYWQIRNIHLVYFLDYRIFGSYSFFQNNTNNTKHNLLIIYLNLRKSKADNFLFDSKYNKLINAKLLMFVFVKHWLSRYIRILFFVQTDHSHSEYVIDYCWINFA